MSINLEQAQTVKDEFHAELQKPYVKCDIGGSAADLMEDALAAALRRLVVVDPGSRKLGQCPYCGGNEAMMDDVTAEGKVLTVAMYCEDCLGAFEENYVFKSVKLTGSPKR